MSTIQVEKLEAGTIIIVESVAGTLYDIEVVSPSELVVKFYSTDKRFKDGPPKWARFLGSLAEEYKIEPGIHKNRKMVFQFADTRLATEPVASAIVFGDGWHYEAIE